LIEKVNGEPVLAPTPDAEQAQVHAALADAGFSRTPRGLRLR
jgi:ATP-dependent Lhr-like helicase